LPSRQRTIQLRFHVDLDSGPNAVWRDRVRRATKGAKGILPPRGAAAQRVMVACACGAGVVNGRSFAKQALQAVIAADEAFLQPLDQPQRDAVASALKLLLLPYETG
jgi:hypothetical protein